MTTPPVTVDASEVAHRLRAIQGGPWNAQTRRAVSFFSPKLPVSAIVEQDYLPLASMLPLLAPKDVERLDDLSHLLRFHGHEGVDDQDELELRDCMDEALTELQLTELAIEMGYIPLEAVREPVRERLTQLLWSGAAREFVRVYDYLSVRYLAARVGVDMGMEEVTPPTIEAGGAVRFALVLAEQRRWYKDKSISEWLGLLDDIIVLDDEQERLESFLLSGRKAPRAKARDRRRLMLLAAGAEQFVLRLSSMLETLLPDERSRVGLLHAYWLAKFFGWDLGSEGYYEVDEGWAEAVIAGAVEEGESDEDTAARRQSFAERVDVLRETWGEVRALEQEQRRTRRKLMTRRDWAWLQIPGLAENEYAESPVAAHAFWTPMARKGVVTIPRAKMKDAVKFIRDKAERDGELTVRLVNFDGSVEQKTFKAGTKSLTGLQGLLPATPRKA